jgi:hypothetical protein
MRLIYSANYKFFGHAKRKRIAGVITFKAAKSLERRTKEPRPAALIWVNTIYNFPGTVETGENRAFSTIPLVCGKSYRCVLIHFSNFSILDARFMAIDFSNSLKSGSCAVAAAA